MAAQKAPRPSKASRKARKVRTEVSSASSSTSSDSEESSPPQKSAAKPSQASTSQSLPQEDAPSHHSSPQTSPPIDDHLHLPAQQAFEHFYLSQATKEFANDLDKLRNAGDFKGGPSVELLVRALKQGEACFGTAERERVGSGG